MDELVKSVAEQTGLSEVQAHQAATAVVKFLKDKLPSPLAGQLDSVLDKPDLAKGAEDILGKGKGLFNRK